VSRRLGKGYRIYHILYVGRRRRQTVGRAISALCTGVLTHVRCVAKKHHTRPFRRV
jgi:hypothetical protein